MSKSEVARKCMIFLVLVFGSLMVASYLPEVLGVPLFVVAYIKAAAVMLRGSGITVERGPWH